MSARLLQNVPVMEVGDINPVFVVPVNIIDASGIVIDINPVQSDEVTSAGPSTIGLTSTQLLAANAARKRLMIQNVGTTRMFILFGTGVASPTNYHVSLPAGGSANDGSSPIYSDTMWTGAIQVISSAIGGSVQAMEFT